MNAEFLMDEKYIQYASIFEKINRYNSNMYTAQQFTKNESFNARHRYCTDVYFSLYEQESVKDLYTMYKEQLMEEYSEEVLLYGMIINEGVGEFFSKVKDNATKKAKEIAGKAYDLIKNGANDIVSWAKEKYDKAVKYYKEIFEWLNNIIKAGVSTVKGFIKSFAEFLFKLGDSIIDGLSKLNVFKKEENEITAEMHLPSDFFEGVKVNNEQADFFNHVYTYINGSIKSGHADKMTESISFAEDIFEDNLLNEGLGSDVMDKIANNKVVQFLCCYGKNKKISLWKSFAISIVGSLVISIVLPLVITALGATAATAGAICTGLSVLWSAKSAFKVILNRWVNKAEGEAFWDRATVIGFLFAVVPTALLQIPAVKEYITDCLKSFCEWLGVDKWIDKLQELYGELMKKLTGTNPNEVTELGKITTEKVRGDLKTVVDRNPNLFQSKERLMSGLAENGATGEQLSAYGKLTDVSVFGSNNIINGVCKQGAEFGDSIPCTIVLDNGEKNMYADAVKAAVKYFANATGENAGANVAYVGNAAQQAASNAAHGTFTLATNVNWDGFAKEFPDYAKYLLDAGRVFGKGRLPGAIKTITHVAASTTKVVLDWWSNAAAAITPTWLPIISLDSVLYDKEKKVSNYYLRFNTSFNGEGAPNAGTGDSKDKNAVSVPLPIYRVAKVKTMKLADVEKIALNKAGFDSLVDNIKKVNHELELLIKKNEEEHKNDSTFKKWITKVKSLFVDSSKIEDTDMLVYYIAIPDQKDPTKMTKMPAIVMDMKTLMCADIFDIETLKHFRSNTAYPMKGMFYHVDFIPADPEDQDQIDELKKSLGMVMKTACKTATEFGCGKMFISGEEGKLESIKDYKSTPIGIVGMFTGDELCDVLNEDKNTIEKAYKMYFGGVTAPDIKIDSKVTDAVEQDAQRYDDIDKVIYLGPSKSEKDSKSDDDGTTAADYNVEPTRKKDDNEGGTKPAEGGAKPANNNNGNGAKPTESKPADSNNGSASQKKTKKVKKQKVDIHDRRYVVDGKGRFGFHLWSAEKYPDIKEEDTKDFVDAAVITALKDKKSAIYKAFVNVPGAKKLFYRKGKLREAAFFGTKHEKTNLRELCFHPNDKVKKDNQLLKTFVDKYKTKRSGLPSEEELINIIVSSLNNVFDILSGRKKINESYYDDIEEFDDYEIMIAEALSDVDFDAVENEEEEDDMVFESIVSFDSFSKFFE